MIVALIVALIMAVDDILDIRKYLMQNNNIVKKTFRFIKNVFVVAMSFFSCNELK